jgi:hypothetical protein
MKNIAIVGAGQAGLQLGFELLNRSGFNVTIFTDTDAEAVLNSAAPPVPIQFAPTVTYEKELGLDFWREEKPTHIDGVKFQLFTPEGEKALIIEAPLKIKAQTVDLRLKYSEWMKEFEKRKGKLVITELSVDLLEKLSEEYDAVFVGTGKQDMSSVFEKDQEKCRYEQPQRRLALFYAKGCELNYNNDPSSGGSSYNIMQGAGELIMSPFLSKDKERIFYILFEALPGGPLDFFDKEMGAEKALEKAKGFLKYNYPELFEMIKNSELCGADEWVCGALTPYVRKPVGKLPSGNVVMPIGDLLILNDPVMAQGLNGASKLARFLAQQITPEAEFTEEWINEVFAKYWATAKYNNEITYSMLEGPQPHQQQLLGAASQNDSIANDFVNGIGSAVSMFPWFGDAEEAQKYLESKQEEVLAV